MVVTIPIWWVIPLETATLSTWVSPQRWPRTSPSLWPWLRTITRTLRTKFRLASRFMICLVISKYSRWPSFLAMAHRIATLAFASFACGSLRCWRRRLMNCHGRRMWVCALLAIEGFVCLSMLVVGSGFIWIPSVVSLLPLLPRDQSFWSLCFNCSFRLDISPIVRGSSF